jgi:hypothetical protein
MSLDAVVHERWDVSPDGRPALTAWMKRYRLVGITRCPHLVHTPERTTTPSDSTSTSPSRAPPAPRPGGLLQRGLRRWPPPDDAP